MNYGLRAGDMCAFYTPRITNGANSQLDISVLSILGETRLHARRREAVTARAGGRAGRAERGAQQPCLCDCWARLSDVQIALNSNRTHLALSADSGSVGVVDLATQRISFMKTSHSSVRACNVSRQTATDFGPALRIRVFHSRQAK